MPQTHITRLPLHTRYGVLARIRSAVLGALTRRRDRQRLGQLDAHLLRDIGLDPQDARRECTKAFWQS